MGSEGNKINDGTGFRPSEPQLCVNGCGFFGSAATMNLCSKCYRDFRVKEEQVSSAKAAMEKLVIQTQPGLDGFSVEPRVGPSSSAAPEALAVAPTAGVESAVQTEEKAKAKAANRCSCCNKKVGVLGFQCRCGATFCGTHRYPETHDCSFDFKVQGRQAIAKANPVVKADKVERF